MWITYRNRHARRAGIWVDGYLPSTHSVRREDLFGTVLLQELRKRMGMRAVEADVRLLICNTQFVQAPESSFENELYLHATNDYRQLLFTTPYKDAKRAIVHLKDSLKYLGFKSSRDYKDYEGSARECKEILKRVTGFYERPVQLAKEYLSERSITPVALM